jgi:hypothetical protein
MKVHSAKLYQAVRIGRDLTTYLAEDKGMKLEYSNGILMVEHPSLDLNSHALAVTHANIMDMLVEKPKASDDKSTKKSKGLSLDSIDLNG